MRRRSFRKYAGRRGYKTRVIRRTSRSRRSRRPMTARKAPYQAIGFRL